MEKKVWVMSSVAGKIRLHLVELSAASHVCWVR
jgi:hypothetical protein